MADEELGRTVLCEAMEYLARLATNLGCRTVSMKEKRINKSKLRDSQSVKNAAEKVLLLCQLSKKSIENVEKSIQEIIPQDTTDEGGKTDVAGSSGVTTLTDKKSAGSNTQKKISKLRYPKQVNVDHYKSVKVLARSMPFSMMDKYPIYYNCKLYRARKRDLKRTRKESCSPVKENIEVMSENEFEHSATEDVNNSCQKNNDLEKTENIIVDESTKPNIDITEGVKSTVVSSQKNDEIVDDGKSSSYSKSLNDSPNLITAPNDLQSKDFENSNNDFMTSQTEKESDKIDCHSALVSDLSNSNKRVKSKTGLKKKKYPSSKRIQSSSDEEIMKNRSKNCRQSKVLHASSDSENNISEKAKEHTEASVIELDSDSEGKQANCAIKHDAVQCDEGVTPEEEKDENLAHVEHDDKSRQNETLINSDENKDASSDNNHTDHSESNKPLIKCVNISKLLKPSVDSSSLPKRFKPNKVEEKVVVHMNRKGELKSKVINLELLDKPSFLSPNRSKSNHVDSDDSLSTKRLNYQVKNFVPREFTIDLVRMSMEFNTEFLQENKLRRITKNGLVICDMPSKNKGKNEIYSSDETNVISTPVKSKLVKAKNTLLNDSDEEDADLQTPSSVANLEEAEKVKKSLLGDSDSDKNEMVSTTIPDKGLVESHSTLKKTLLNDSDGERADLQTTSTVNRETEKIKKSIDKETEKIKESLLGDSDSDKNEMVSNTIPDKGLVKSHSPVNKTLLNESDGERADLQTTSTVNSETEKIKESIDKETEKIKETVDKETEKIKESVDRETEKIKESLLGDSDSDKNEIASTKKFGDNLPEALSHEGLSNSPSKSTSPVRENSKIEGHDKQAAKSALLNDSSGSDDSSEKNKKPNSDNKSRRKHIMESMRAKKMLLTYSSSSDTEDEQLKTALKDIKDSLLKDISSEKEKNEQNVRKNRHCSDSDEDISNSKKKRRKLQNSNTSGSENRHCSDSDEDISNSKKKRRKHQNSNTSDSDKESKNKENTESKEDEDEQVRLLP